MAKAKLRILYGEGDGDVFASQAAAFEKAGHIVQKPEGRESMEVALKQVSFDLVIVG